VVHFALNELCKSMEDGDEADVVARMKEHISRNKGPQPKIE